MTQNANVNEGIRRAAGQQPAQPRRSTRNAKVNRWLRAASGRPDAPTTTPGPSASELANAKDVAGVLGLTLTEALARMTGEPQPVPRGDAGAGTGAPIQGAPDMNRWIRLVAGH